MQQAKTGENGVDPRRQDVVLAVMLTLASLLIATGRSSTVKWIGPALPVGELMFMRGATAVLVTLFIAWRTQKLSTLSLRKFLSYAPRTFTASLAQASWFLAVTHAPLAVASAVGYTSPIFTVLFGMWFLGERVRPIQWIGVAIGFTGVLIMSGSSLQMADASLVGILLALSASMFASLTPVFTREMTRLESTIAIAFYFAMTHTVAGALTSVGGWVMPGPREWLALGLLGLIGSAAAIIGTAAMRYAEVSKLAPLNYVQLVFYTFVGLWVFNEIPALSFWAALPLMLMPGLLILWTDYRDRRRARAQPEISPAAGT